MLLPLFCINRSLQYYNMNVNYSIPLNLENYAIIFTKSVLSSLVLFFTHFKSYKYASTFGKLQLNIYRKASLRQRFLKLCKLHKRAQQNKLNNIIVKYTLPRIVNLLLLKQLTSQEHIHFRLCQVIYAYLILRLRKNCHKRFEYIPINSIEHSRAC